LRAGFNGPSRRGKPQPPHLLAQRPAIGFHPIEKDQQVKHCRGCRYYEHMSENLVLDTPVTAIENMSVTEALDELRHDDAVIAQYEARKIRAMHRIHEL